ncbi:MAG: 50S ribosomal protein L18Ae [Thermoplasmata archaeon]|nr:50S ribosomal protein L18Ae [Thermoplasmata archaeon]
MNAYRVTGNFRMRDRAVPFTMEVVADDAEGATERVNSLIGSKHRVKRRKIEIGEVKKISPKEATDPTVKFHLGGGR